MIAVKIQTEREIDYTVKEREIAGELNVKLTRLDFKETNQRERRVKGDMTHYLIKVLESAMTN